MDSKYLYYYLLRQTNEFLDIRTSIARPNLSQDKISFFHQSVTGGSRLKNFKIPLIPINAQKAVVFEMEKIEREINHLKEENKGLELEKDNIINRCII